MSHMPPKASPLYSALAAFGGILVASSCCLPLGAFYVAAGLAGASGILNGLRPYLMALSVGLILYGFWQARRARQCQQRPSAFNLVVLWSSAVFVAGSLLFPQALAGLMAGRVGDAPAGQSAVRSLDLAAFQREFDQTADVRVLVLLSPT